EPGISVSVAARRPPVQDSAAATFSDFIRHRSSSDCARSRSSGSAMSVTPGQPDRRIGERRDAFAASGEAELFAGGRLPPDARHRNAGDLGDARAHALAMGTNALCFAYERDVDTADAPATRRDPLH